MIHEHCIKMNATVENTTLKKVLNQFNQITGGKAKQIQLPKSEANKGVDAIFQLTLGKEKHIFLVEVKNELRQTNIPPLLSKIGKNKENWIFLSQ
jgi:hypothetical protein